MVSAPVCGVRSADAPAPVVRGRPRARRRDSLHRGRSIYYGWVVVGVATFAMFAATLTGGAGFSVFIPAMAQDLGWSRSVLAGALSIGTLVGALAAPFAGRLIDRYGSRAALAASGLGIAVTLAIVSGVRTELVFILAYGIARAIDMGALNLAVTTAVANWFARRRGRALGIAMTGNAIGVMLLVPLCQWLIDGPGWRVAWLVVGSGSGLVLAVAAAVLLRRRPEDIGLRPDGDPWPTKTETQPETPRAASATGSPGPRASTEQVSHERDNVDEGWTARRAARSSAFWLLVLASAGSQLAVAGVTTHQASILAENGLSTGAVAAGIGAFGLAWTLGSLVWGLIIERLAARRALALASLLVAACATAVLFVRDPALLVPYALVYGLANGGKEALDAVVWADYFGRRSVGAIRGLSRPVVVGAGALGSFVGGVGYDLTGSYQAVVLGFVACALLSAAASLAAVPPRRLSVPERAA